MDMTQQDPAESGGPSPAGIVAAIVLIVGATTVNLGFFTWQGLALTVGAAGTCVAMHLRPGMWPGDRKSVV